MSNPLLPKDGEGREMLAEEIQRAVNLLNEIDVLKADIKSIAENVEDKLNVKKAAFSKLAKAKYKEDAESTRMEAEDIEVALGILFAEED